MIINYLSNYIYGYYGDPLIIISNLSNIRLTLLQSQTLTWLILFIPKILTGSEAIAYNIVLLFSFLFAFATAFFLASYIIKEEAIKETLQKIIYSSLVAAIIFTFSQYMLWQGTQHIELIISAGFLPLYFWRFFEYRKEYSAKNALYLALSFAAVFLTSFYYGYFIAILTAPLFLLRFKKQHLTFALASFFLTLPATLSFIQFKLGINTGYAEVGNIGLSIQRNTIEEVFRLTARPWDFLLPSINHPFFGKFTDNFYKNTNPNMSWQLWSAYLPERAVFIGWTALVLAVMGIVVSLEKVRFQISDLKFQKILLYIALAALVLSLPPFVSFQGQKIPINPNYLLFKLFPMFRAYIRAAIIFQLFLAIFAGHGFFFLNRYISRLKLRHSGFADKANSGIRNGGKKLDSRFRGNDSIVVFLIIAFIIIFENLSLPLPFVKANNLTPMYQYTKEAKEVKKIAEFPWDHDPTGDCGSANYDTTKQKGYPESVATNFQRFHKKDLLQQSDISNTVYNLKEETTYERLKENGVTHILVHTKDYFENTENPLDNCQNYRFYKTEPEVWREFKKVEEFEDGVIFAL